ncbi:unnamed protein product, partial [Porites evermanni]
QPSKLTLHEKFFTHPPLLPGEQIVSQQDQVTCVDTFNDVAEGILHITTYRIIFAGCYAQSYLEQGEYEYLEAEPEEVARRGHYYQTRSRKTSFGPRAKLHNARSCDDAETKQMKRLSAHNLSKRVKGASGIVRGVRHSQSMIRKTPTVAALPGLADQSLKLQTLRPVHILSNIEHVDHDYEIVASIPLASICDVKKFSRKNMPKDKQMFLMDGFEVFCSNIQSYRFCLGLQSTSDAETVIKTIHLHSKRGFPKLFSFIHKTAILLPKSCDILDRRDAPNFYDFKSECDRLKLFHTDNWR